MNGASVGSGMTLVTGYQTQVQNSSVQNDSVVEREGEGNRRGEGGGEKQAAVLVAQSTLNGKFSIMVFIE